MPRAVSLSSAIEQYVQHLQARDLARASVRNNRQVLNKALACWGDMQVQSVQPRHIDRLFAENSWSASTRNLYLTYLRSFFAWCRGHGYMGRDFDPTTGWRNARVPVVQKMRLPVSEFRPLLDACEHPRDRAVVAIGLFTFLRGSEIQTLKVSDLDLRGNELVVYRHKTREEDTLPVSAELGREMARWLSWYQRDQGHLYENWYLCPSKKPDQWKPAGPGRMVRGELSGLRPTEIMTHPYRCVQRALASLGYDTKGEGEHTLRRSGARALFDRLRSEGYDGALMRVSSMLGHRDTRVTEKYIGLSLERTQRNDMLAGRVMFPDMGQEQGLRVVGADG